MKRLQIIAILLICTAAASRAQTTSRFSVPSPVRSALSTEPFYEIPPVLRASEIWEGNLLQGPNHRVREDVVTSDFGNNYTIDSEFGVFHAFGDHMLLERVREIYAIAAFRKTKESAAYTKAVGSGAVNTLKGAGNLVKNPGKAISGIGKGTGRVLRSIGERLTTTAKRNDSANDLKQYTQAKRTIAGKYKVDPYTSNKVYQSEVEGIAAATSAGGLTFTLASLAIPGGGGIALRSLGTSEKLNEKLVQAGPYDLRVQNKGSLRKMSLREDDIEAFLDHPHFTPRHCTAITLALEQLRGTRYRGDYIRLSLSADSEGGAFFFSRSAAILALYHRNRSKIIAIFDCDGTPAAYTAEGRLVLPMLLDYGCWTRGGDRLTHSLLNCHLDEFPVESREIVISGVLTPRARQEMDIRGIIVTEQAFQTLAP